MLAPLLIIWILSYYCKRHNVALHDVAPKDEGLIDGVALTMHEAQHIPLSTHDDKDTCGHRLPLARSAPLHLHLPLDVMRIIPLECTGLSTAAFGTAN